MAPFTEVVLRYHHGPVVPGRIAGRQPRGGEPAPDPTRRARGRPWAAACPLARYFEPGLPLASPPIAGRFWG